MFPARNSKKSYQNQETNVAILKNIGYTIGKKIGEGTYSRVCVAVRTFENGIKKKYACKIINKKCTGEDFIKRFLPRELKIVAMIDHPNIVTVSNILEINDTIYMFMDYCSNGDFLEYIQNSGPLSESRAKFFFRHLVSAIEYLHNRNIAHRDLKCENILLTSNNSIKLGDFGFARSCLHEQNGTKILSNTFCGSAAYAAPEILQGISYDPKMYDIWALGCILYIMLTASMPFDDSNIKKMLKSQLSRTLPSQNIFAWKMRNAESLIQLVRCLLEPDVSKRFTIAKVVNCQWFKELTSKRCRRYLVSNNI